MPGSAVLYFAYGSNADPERFRARVGPWRTVRRAWLDDHRLRFAASVQSEGGGGAVVDACPGEAVAGVLYELRAAQLEAMDQVEFAAERARSGIGRRVRVLVRTEEGSVAADLYTVTDDGAVAAPSGVYLGHILRGLAAAGHDEASLERVRRIAAGSA